MRERDSGVVAVLQARMSSTRLPGKVLKPLLGHPMLARQIERLERSRRIGHLIVATSITPSDDRIADVCADLRVPCYRGALDDVLDRFYHALLHGPSHVVRLTADCPLADPAIIDATIDFYLGGGFDYASNTIEPTFPDGLDVEVFRFRGLEEAWREATSAWDREHVTPFIYRHLERYRIGHYKRDEDLSHLRWTVDYPEDFSFVEAVYQSLYPWKPDFATEDTLKLLEQQPTLVNLNAKRSSAVSKESPA
jgi:spore coat polysaccharide biosynthesis protein SpsF